MERNEIWNNNDIKNINLRIIEDNNDGSVSVAFDFNHFEPKRIFSYQKWYIEKHYTNTGTKHSWSIDPSLKNLSVENV